MGTILLTGATGFVGSSLAANFLARGINVLALTRNDANGIRSRDAIRKAAKGFDLDFHENDFCRLETVECALDDLQENLDPTCLNKVTAAWHTAADMRYSIRTIQNSMHTNVGGSSALYRLLAAHAPRCKRFFHVSTAYTANLFSQRVEEKLHCDPSFINAYQTSKWMTEQILFALQQLHHLPITIFRPSIVLGRASNGWMTGSAFGYYMFVEAILLASLSGIKMLRLDISPNSRVDLVSIDDIVSNAMALTDCYEQQKQFDIVHATGGMGPSTAALTQAIKQQCGVRVVCSKPMSNIERKIDRSIAANRIFQRCNLDFSNERIKSILGDSYQRITIDDSVLERIVGFYAERYFNWQQEYKTA